MKKTSLLRETVIRQYPMRTVYRKQKTEDLWHFCENCPEWPKRDYIEQEYTPIVYGPVCDECKVYEQAAECETPKPES
jgi:hypothetical protein